MQHSIATVANPNDALFLGAGGLHARVWHLAVFDYVDTQILIATSALSTRQREPSPAMFGRAIMSVLQAIRMHTTVQINTTGPLSTNTALAKRIRVCTHNDETAIRKLISTHIAPICVLQGSQPPHHSSA